MERTNLRKFIVLVVMLALGLLGSNMAFGQSPPNGTIEDSVIELRNLLASIEGVSVEPPRIHLTKDGYLRFIMAPQGTRFGMAEGMGKKPEEIAEAFLRKWRGLFVTESSAVDFDAIRTVTRTGYTYVRYQQKYAGLEVFDAQMTVEVSNNGGIGAVMSDIMPDPAVLDTGRVSLNPTIDALTARRNAAEWLAAQHPGLEFEASTLMLIIFDPRVVGWEGEPQLVWHTKVWCTSGGPVGEGVLVNAHSGHIAFNYSLVVSAQNRRVYDYSQVPDIPWPPESPDGEPDRGENEPATGDADIDDMWEYLEDTYWFYDYYHGRDSYDDGGADLIGAVKFVKVPTNAWWIDALDHPSVNEPYMLICGGCVTDDTVGHEFTHGVTRRESNLRHAATQSGAINESFSDMWGEWVDLENGADAPGDRWYLFEDDPEGPFRYMRDPTEAPFGHPDRMSDYREGGDPHINCGIANKLCYLLTDGSVGEPGGQFNGYTISGMGISNTADLFYECQTDLLLEPSSDYYDLGDALVWAACRIGLNPDERKNVRNACVAVEILANPEDCYPFCDPSYADWVAMAKPVCWCGIYGQPPWPYQCDGDADGKHSGGINKYRVFTGDLSLIVANWQKKLGDPTLNPCADIDHKDSGGINKYRVFTGDLNIVVANWRKRDADLPGDCPRCEQGQQAKAGELTLEELVKWLEDVWLDPEVRQAINEDAWLKFVESLMEEIQDWPSKPN